MFLVIFGCYGILNTLYKIYTIFFIVIFNIKNKN